MMHDYDLGRRLWAASDTTKRDAPRSVAPAPLGGDRSLFVLTGGAFQWVSAMEAAARYGSKSDKRYLFASQRAHYSGDLRSLGWSDTKLKPYVSPNGSRRAARWYRQGRFVRSAVRYGRARGPIDKLFIGSLGAPFQAIANGVKPQKVIVLDDGTATLMAMRARHDRRPTRKFSSMVERSMQSLKYGWPPVYGHSVEFFTVFANEFRSKEDTLYENDFSVLRRVGSRSLINRALFLGTPALSLGICSREVYAEMLAMVDNEVSLPVSYRPHQLEAPDDLGIVPEGWAIEESDRPVELEMLESGSPKVVVGWFSTALIGCRMLCNDASSVLQIVVPDRIVASGWREKIKRCQAAIRCRNVCELTM